MSSPLDHPKTVFHDIPGGQTRRIDFDVSRMQPGLYVVDEQDGLHLCVEIGADQPPRWTIYDTFGRERDVFTGSAVFVSADSLKAAAAKAAEGAVMSIVDGGTPTTREPQLYICTANSDGGSTCWKQ